MVQEGPFQNIVDCFFFEEGGYEPSPCTISCYVLWGIWKPDTWGWTAIFSDFISNQPPGNSNVVRVINGQSPDTIDAPDEVVGPVEFDPVLGQYFSVVTKVTGKEPTWNEGDIWITYTDPDPRNTFSGSNCIAPSWTITFRRYYFFLGIHHEQLLTKVESSVSFSFAGVVLRGVDGALYTGGTFETGTPFPRLIVTPQ